MVIDKLSKEFREQIKYKRKDERSMVHPLLVTNEPELYIAVEDIVESFFKSEEVAWKRVVNSSFPVQLDSSGSHSSGYTTPSGCSSIHIPHTDNIVELIGDAFLWHGRSCQDIHFYFWKLDPRRNRVKKVDGHSAVSQPLKLLESTSTVRENKGVNKRSNKKRQWTNPLSAEDKEIYKLLLKCALHPPLDEPMPSPSNFSRGMSRNVSVHVDAVSIEHNRLMLKPMRAFRINQNLHDKLKYEVLCKLPGKDITMALTTELMDQMARLESNECLFYQPADFANADFYENWRRLKIDFVNRLLWKWCPTGNCSLMAHIARNVNCHEAYKIIVDKFLNLDLREKVEASKQKLSHKTVTSILTTESRKLLNEFCLWYGIEGIYRQLAILDAMVKILSLNICDWYLECLLLAFTETMDFINERQNFLVNAEKMMAENIFLNLTKHIKDGFEKLYYMYKKVLSGKGIETLVLLLQHVLQAKHFFRLMERNEENSINFIVNIYVDLAASHQYKYIKESAEFNCRQNEGNDSSDRSVEVFRQMLQDIRKCVKITDDLTNNCSILIQKCPNIIHVVANKLYTEFMEDIKELCLLHTDTIEFSKVNNEMMGLAYRLDKLDTDWEGFIPPEKQKWRRYFKIVLDIFIKAIAQDLIADITNYILKDDSEILQLNLHHDTPCPSPVASLNEHAHSIQLSESSAFTSVTSTRSSKSSSLTPSNVQLLKKSLHRGSAIDVEWALNKDVSEHFEPPVSCTDYNTDMDLSEEVKDDIGDENNDNSPKNIDTNDLLHDIIRFALQDIVDNVVKICDEEVDKCRSSPNLSHGISEIKDRPVSLKQDFSNEGDSILSNSDFHVNQDDQCKNIDSGRRCYSDPTSSSAINNQPSFSKLSAASLRYVRDGPSLDCLVEKHLSYPHHQNDIICNYVFSDSHSNSDAGSTFSSLDCERANVSHEYPENGQILTTSSVTDVLISTSRLISFAKTVCMILLPSIENRSHFENKFSQERYDIRVDIFRKVLAGVKDVLQSYATNIISLDNCGSDMFQTVRTENRPMNNGCGRLGDVCVQDVRKGSLPSPGCRHIREKVMPMKNSRNGKPCRALKILLDESFGKWELVTRQMCFRINNVYSLMKVMPILQKITADRMNVDLEEFLIKNVFEQKDDFTCYDACPCKTPAKQLCRDLGISQVYFSKILHMQVKLLTLRVMDIYNKLFNELQSIPRRQRSICEQMKSCMTFLRSQMKFFRHAMYEKCIHLVVIQICKFLVDKFHDLLDEMYKLPEDPHVRVMHLKDLFMGTMRSLNAGTEIKQQMNKEMQVILFRFQIFILPLDNLRKVFDVMEDIETERSSCQLDASRYTMQELIYLVKQELDSRGETVFTGSRFQSLLINNTTWLHEFDLLLQLDEYDDTVSKVKAIGSFFLKEKYMKCCGVVGNQSSNLEVIYHPASLPKDISVKLLTGGGPGKSTKINFTSSGDFLQFSPVSSLESLRSTNTIEESHPYVGSETFFPQENVNYRFETKGGTFVSLLLILLSGEICNMGRQHGPWVETIIRKDIITIFSYNYHMNRSEDAIDFFATYRDIRPIYSRRGSCFW